MARQSQLDNVKLSNEENPIGSVTIFDGEGRVLRVVPAVGAPSGDEDRSARRRPQLAEGEATPLRSLGLPSTLARRRLGTV